MTDQRRQERASRGWRPSGGRRPRLRAAGAVGGLALLLGLAVAAVGVGCMPSMPSMPRWGGSDKPPPMPTGQPLPDADIRAILALLTEETGEPYDPSRMSFPLALDNGQARVQIRHRKVEPSEEGEDGEVKPARKSPGGTTIYFRKVGGVWKAVRAWDWE